MIFFLFFSESANTASNNQYVNEANEHSEESSTDQSVEN